MTTNKIKEYELPGFCMDERGAYGIVLGGVYICCFIDCDDDTYNVTADAMDKNGDFAKNLMWNWFKEPADAVRNLRQMVRRFAPCPG